MRRRRRPAPPGAVGTTLVMGLVLLTGCAAAGPGGGGAEEEGLRVIASSAPLAWLAHRVGGDRARVENLVPPGADSHHLDLTPQQIAGLGDADVVVHLSGLQPVVDRALGQQDVEAVDAAHLADLDADPHFWLDPRRMVSLAAEVSAAFTAADPDGAGDYTAATADVVGDLEALDAEFTTQLEPCRGSTIVAAHEAYGYLADAYGLEQVGITGIDPTVEPSPARVRRAAEAIRGTGARAVFFDAATSARVAEVLADDGGVSVARLDPVERVEEGADYLDLMRGNLSSLRANLICEGS